MVRIVGLVFVFLSTSLLVSADQPRYRNSFVSANGRYKAKLEERKVWRLLETSTEKELYRFDDYYRDGIWFSSMSLVIGDDGQSVVAVNDYAEDFGEQEVRKNPEVLFFFREGKLTKTYKLWQLANPKFLTVSVSHFMWAEYGEGAFGIKDGRLSVTTLDLNEYLFDPASGELIFKKTDQLLSDSAIYIFGEVTGLGGTRHKIVVDCVIRGKARQGDTIYFESKSRRWEGSGFNESLLIDRGQLVSSKGVHFNVCHDKTGR
jgi:hypothetical protein